MGLGIAGLIVGLDALDTEASPWPITATLLFALAGGWIIFHGLSGVLRAARRRRLLRDHPHEPWHADHAWGPRVIHATRRSNVSAPVWVIAFAAALLAPLAIRGGGFDKALRREFLADPLQAARNAEPAGQATAVALVAVPLLLLAVPIGGAFIQRLRYGRGRLECATFPCFLGEPLEGRLNLRSPPGGFSSLKLVLRTIEERAEVKERGARRTNTRNVYQVWSETRELDRTALPPGRDLSLGVRFTPSLHGLETQLSGDPPRYWELAVYGRAAGVDYEGYFLVPVYRRQRTGSGRASVASVRTQSTSRTPPTSVV